MKKISFLNEYIKLGQPVHSRLAAFQAYFSYKGFEVNDASNTGCRYVFYSMPPFRGFSVFFQSKRKVILDIRDGWSIAQASGYGGNSPPKPFKAFITKQVEKFIIKRSYVAITCTTGLVRHLESVSGRKIILIPNGISEERIELIKKLKCNHNLSGKSEDILKFVCAGQFSEYGKDKVEKLLNVIAARYFEDKLVIELIGSSPEANDWTIDYFNKITAGRGVINILPRMNEEELFKQMLNADFGLTIIRDPLYDLGTKVYDYIALGMPVVNYFDVPNNFTNYFDACLDVPFNKTSEMPEIRRSVLIEQGLKDVKF